MVSSDIGRVQREFAGCEENAPPATLPTWLAYLDRIHPHAMDLGLERVGQVRDRLGLFPSYPILIVAGTNGKGSTCAYLTSILKAAGYRVGTYTSPHLVRYNERVVVDGTPVSDARLCAAFARIEAARQEISLTPFEFGTLAAVEIFQRAQVDVAVLEVGLGGRLDAVNLFEPAVSLLTGIALDHETWLGATREAIGAEKAGIFRARVPALCADPDPPRSVLAHATALETPLWLWGRDFTVERQAQGGWTLYLPHQTWSDLPAPSLRGDFQYRNAALALAALQRLPLRVTPEQGRRGISGAVLPGRFQTLRHSPQVILDVAHNPQAAQELAHNLEKATCPGRTRLVLGMLRDKDRVGVVQALDSVVDDWYLADLHEARGACRAEMEPALRGVVRGTVQWHPSPEQAYGAACAAAAAEDRVVVCGSFVTVGRILALQESGPEMKENSL
ncbi:bifunctional tetrahydrofolate synthase/dihydrofolate synthase [Ferrovum sp.]|uniref:bifunctional tetrahydrofolate synthase/dihydrofolate synthase n=1 Tax=Ferrovum sp. TaxID=2609467 RepID=UPI0026181D52|nr:bifunctional tetrahydrofolate synthase/dihydrofolate synthase [Ferrovum sp.]